MYEYKAKIVKVIDGDTVDVDIDLGFGMWMKDERVRIMGIDTPESRTRDLVEKQFGLAAKARLKELLGKSCILKTQVGKGGEDMKGKFGRILKIFSVFFVCFFLRSDGVWHRESHYWKKFIGGGTQDTDFNKGNVGSFFDDFSKMF